MDVEYRLALLQWAERASMTQRRRALQIAAAMHSTAALTPALSDSITLALGRGANSRAQTEAATEAGDTQAQESQSNGASSSSEASSQPTALSPAVQTHVARFVRDTVEAFEQLTSFLLTEQVSS